jgi:tRNA-dependent cyclodipeptide synthase
MKIVKCFGTTLERIANKEHNIYVGISPGNKYFTKERIYRYLEWALQNSREPPLLLIPDTLQAHNYEAFKNYEPAQARTAALRHGENEVNKAKHIINRLKAQYPSSTIEIARGEDVTNNDLFRTRLPVVFDEYAQNPEFAQTINNIITTNLLETKKKEILTDKNICTAARYILIEIPLFLDMIYRGRRYDLLPYPGNTMAQFMDDLQTFQIFPELGKKLGIERKIAEVEAYAD